MANPLTVEEQQLSTDLRAKSGWEDGAGCALLYRRSSFALDEWHQAISLGAGSAVDLEDRSDVDLGTVEAIQLDFTSDALPGYLAAVTRDLAATKTVISYVVGTGYTARIDNGDPVEASSLAELLATLLVASMP